jgi:hypothetical protein
MELPAPQSGEKKEHPGSNAGKKRSGQPANNGFLVYIPPILS